MSRPASLKLRSGCFEAHRAKKSRPAFVAVMIIKTIHNILDQFMFHSCRFMPSCSSYAQEAIGVHGVRRGSWLILRRLARCRPLGPRGFDPVA